MRDPDPTTGLPVTFGPQALTDLVEAVTLDLMLRLEAHRLVEVPPNLSRRMDRYVEWLGENGSEPREGLSEALGLGYGNT